MVEFLTSEEILKNKEMLKTKFLSSLSWAARSESVKQYIKEHFSHDMNILDIGCGGGDTLKALRDGGYKNIFGFDIDNYVKYDDLKNYVRTGDLNFEKLPFPDKNFDLITAFQVMEHLENPFQFERECNRLLKPGGALILSIPSGQSIWSRINYFVSNNVTGYDLVNNHITFLLADVFKKIFLKDFAIDGLLYDKGFVPYLPRLKLPPHKLLSKRVCYFLKRL